MNHDEANERAIEGREVRDRYFGASAPEPHWQVSIVFGPCSFDNANELFDDVFARLGSMYGSSYSLEQLDEPEGGDE